MNLFLLSYPLTFLVAYLLGSSNMAYYVSRWKGVDLRTVGSNNLGTSNTFMTFGLGWAALVFLHDAGKTVLAVLLARALFPDAPAVEYLAGLSSVLGHIFPFYLKFKGGKGFAAFLGLIFALDWRLGLLALVLVAVLTLSTNYIVVGTVAVVLSYPVYVGCTTKAWLPTCLVALATLVILFRHRENFIHIANGTEIGLRH